MKKVLSLFFGIGTLSLVFAQQTNQSVIAASGNYDQVNTTSIEWTLGELAVQSLEGSNIMLTEGFHQPLLDAFLGPPHVLLSSQIKVSVSPNPTQGILKIKINSELDQSAVLSLSTLVGRLVQNETINLSQGGVEWNISKYFSGLYLLTLHTEKGQLVRSFKIIKYY